MSQEVRAKARHIPVSPQKARLVIDLVRGKDVVDALDMLEFVPNRAAKPVAKLIRSAIANAENNIGMNRYDLMIDQMTADDGPTGKWRRFGARGRVKPRLRRTSHLSIVLREKEQA